MDLLTGIWNWSLNNWSSIISIIILCIFSWLLNKFFEKENVKQFFNKKFENKIVKNLIKEIKSFIGKALAIAFFFTLFGSTLIHILSPETFPNFISQFIIAGLTLGVFSIAMATLINQSEKEKLSPKAKRYTDLSKDFILSGVYLIFAYFFWMVVSFNYDAQNSIMKVIVNAYLPLTVITLIVALCGLISGMWNLIRENT